MKTNIGIETTDEQRALIAKSLGHEGLVSRKQLTKAVENYVMGLIDGGAPTDILDDPPDTTEEAFKPTRGDEPYIFKAKDPELKKLHSRFLDLVDDLEAYTWTEMEKNRD